MADPGYPIQMLWVSGALPWYAEASIKSFMKHGHRVELYAYDPPPNLPTGCTLKDAEGIVPRTRIFTYKSGHHEGHLSGFSNWFRYSLLVRHGGWWSDCDVICVAPFADIEKEFVFASEYKPPNPRSVNGNVIFCREANTAIMRDCLAYSELRGSDIEHAEAGPVLLDKLVHKFDLGKFIVDPDLFNPIHFFDTRLLFRTRFRLSITKITRRARGLRPVYLSTRTKGVHLYASVLTECGTVMSSASQIPPRSYLAQLTQPFCYPTNGQKLASIPRPS